MQETVRILNSLSTKVPTGVDGYCEVIYEKKIYYAIEILLFIAKVNYKKYRLISIQNFFLFLETGKFLILILGNKKGEMYFPIAHSNRRKFMRQVKMYARSF